MYTITKQELMYFILAMIALFFFLILVVFPAIKKMQEHIKMARAIKRLNRDWEAKYCGKNKQRRNHTFMQKY